MIQQLCTDAEFTEHDCMLALFQAKWPNGYRCPRCKHHDAYRISTRRLPLYECKQCHTQTSLTVNTIMEGSRTPLTSWFRAIALHASPDGINAKQLAQLISVTYKTAWLICHKIRHAMRQAEAKSLLTGLVKLANRVYRNFFSAETAFKWHPRSHPIMIGAAESSSGHIHSIKIKLQSRHGLRNKYEMPDPINFIEQNVSEEANVLYIGKVRKLDVTEVRRLGLIAQNRIADVYRGVSAKHLQAYLDQFCYIWNNSRSKMLFVKLLTDCAATRTIRYNELTAPANNDFCTASLAA